MKGLLDRALPAQPSVPRHHPTHVWLQTTNIVFPGLWASLKFILIIILVFFWYFINLILKNFVTPLVCLLYGVITEGHSKSLKQKKWQTQLVGPPIDINWPTFLEVNEASNSWGFSSFFLIISLLITALSFFRDHHSWKLHKRKTITSPNNYCNKVVGTYSADF